MPHASPYWAAFINKATAEYSIDVNRKREACFLAQVAEETQGLKHLVEDLDYSAARLVKVWPQRFTDQTALAYAHNPVKLGNFIYANRMGNGDEASGDGSRFLGRGGLMLTGRAAYAAAGFSLGLDLLADPTVVSRDWTTAMRTAAWEFAGCNGNQLADDGDFAALTQCINGGLTGLASRQAYLQLATQALT